MKPNEWAAIIFGFLGFALSCLSLLKSLKGERQGRMRDLSQKRTDALLAVLSAEAQICSERREFKELAEACAQQGHAKYRLMADEMVEFCDKKLGAVEIAKAELKKPLPKTRYEETYASLDRVIIEMRDLADDERAKDQKRDYIGSIRTNLQLEEQLNEARQKGD